MSDFHFSYEYRQTCRTKTRKRKSSPFYAGYFCSGEYVFFFLCVEKTCFSIAILLEYTAPIYVMLASPFILKEKVGKENIAALFLAIAGVYMVIRPDGGFEDLEFSGDHILGIASGLFAGFLLAIIIMNVRVLKKGNSEFSIAFWSTAISCFFMIPFAFEIPVSILGPNILSLMAFGVVTVGVGGILNTIGFANLQSQTGSLLALIEPVAGVFFDLAFLGVSLSTGTLMGCFLVLASSIIVSYRSSPKPEVKNKEYLEPIEN